MKTAVLREGAAGKARITVSGKGPALPLPALATLTGPLDVQIQPTGGGSCFAARYSAPLKKHDATRLVDKAD